jgi:hypothetical protein
MYIFLTSGQSCLKLIRQVTESESIMKEKVARQITPRLMVFRLRGRNNLFSKSSGCI